MVKKNSTRDGFEALRQKAEKIARKRNSATLDADEVDLVRLSNELEVQRVELEMQNEELREANRQLEVSRNDFANLYQFAPVAFLNLSRGGLIENANETAVRMLADDASFGIGGSFEELVYPADRHIFRAYLEKIKEAKTAEPSELRIRNQVDGTLISVQLKAGLTYDESGRVSGWLLALEDITERKRVYEELRSSETRMRSLFRAAPIGIGVVVDRVVQEVNQECCRILGYPRNEIIGRSARQIYPTSAEFEQVGREKYAQMDRYGVGTVETRMRRKDGKILHVLLSSTPIDSRDLSQGVTFTVMDITEHKQAEAALRESEEKFSKAFYTSPFFLFICELETGVYIDVNHAYCALTGYRREEMVGRSSLELGIVSGSKRAELVRQFHQARSLQNLELQIVTRSGDARFCIFSAERMEYRGKPCLIYSGIDITERMQAEQALKRSEESLRLAVEGGRLGTWRREIPTGEVHWNHYQYKLFGRDPNGPAIAANTFYDYIHPDDLPRILSYREEVFRSRNEFVNEFRVIREDGEIRWLFAHGRLYRDAEGQPIRIAGINFDITDRKQAEEELRKLKENLEINIEQRTQELRKTVRQLKNEIEERKRAQLQLRELTGKTIHAMEHDRRTLSKEIHDSIGGSLAAIKMLLETQSEHLLPSNQDAMREIIGHLTESIKESKRISYQLRPRVLDDFGLIAALSESIRAFKQFYPAVRLDHRIDLSLEKIPDEIQTSIYRIIQEAMTNIGKHSRASSAVIELSESDDRILLKVADDGVGFDVSTTFNPRQPLQGYGLLSMKERVEICRGTFVVDSAPRKGTRLAASIPKTLWRISPDRA